MSNFWNAVSQKSRDNAKDYRDNLLETEIWNKLLRRFWYWELERLKYEFKKYIVHCIVEGKSNVFWVDGFDGSRKTSITTELTNPSTVYANNGVLKRASLWIPSDEEKMKKITELYEVLFPGAWRTLFLDRSWNNRAFVQHLYWYCNEGQYEEFLDTLANELERFLWEYEDLRIVNFFFEITQKEQKQRLEERKKDPLRNHRYSESDATAPEKYDAILKQRDILAPIYEKAGIPFMTVKTIDKKRAMIALLKIILQDEDYAKKSKEIDFNPDKKIIQPTKDETARILQSKK